MSRKHLTRYFLLQWVAGIFVCSLLFWVFTELKLGQFETRDTSFVALMALSSLLLYTQSNTYINKSKLDSIYKIFIEWTLVLAICVATMFIFKVSDKFSRIVLLELYVFGFVAQIISYVLVKSIFSNLSRSPNGLVRVAVLGQEKFTQAFSKALLLRRNEILVGYVEPTTKKLFLNMGSKDSAASEILHLTSDVLERNDIRKIYLSYHMDEYAQVVDAYREYSGYPIELDWHLLFDGESRIDSALVLLKNFPFVQLSETPNQPSPLFGAIKRVFDIFASAIIILLLSPLLISIALIVKVSSPGPVIFKQKRHGLHGAEISVFKFRSMYVHQSDKLVQATKNDVRITPIGRFIRKTSIDELPQLFNVLAGSMSLVGPRPHPVEFNEYYGPSINEYMMRHRIKPGITGLAQIYGARGETETIEKMLRRIKLDLEYINHQSMLLDMKILFLTPFALVLHTGH